VKSYWRRHARAAIEAALRSGRAKGLDGKELEQHVSDAYPFGVRQHHPYRVWLNEFSLLVRGERKLMTRKGAAGPKLLGEWPMTEAQREYFEGG
jgi:hypothetical protein